MHAFLTCVVWIGLMPPANPAADAVQADKDKLKGTWVLKAVRDGDLNAKDTKRDKWPKEWRELRLTFTADRMVMKSAGLRKAKPVPYKIDPSQHPKALDLDGGGFKNEWIYKLQGNTLVLAFPLGLDLVAGGTYAERQRDFGRPHDFKATNETAAPIIWILKRVKR